MELPKSKYEASTLAAELGELLQAKPYELTYSRPPLPLARKPTAG